MRYKILFISSWFPNKLEPTNGNFVRRHAESVLLRHDVEILHAIGDPNQKEKYLVENEMINEIRTVIVYYRNSKNPAQNIFRRFHAYQKGFSLLKQPDLIHANILQNSMLFAVYLKRKHKIPFVVTEHWSGFLSINRSKLSKHKILTAKIIAEKSSYILPVSNYLKNDLEKFSWNAKYKVIQNVVDTNIFSTKNEVPESVIFLHISNLIPLKNADKIINTAIKLRQNFKTFELHIGGDGDVEKLHALIKSNHANDFIKTFSLLSANQVAQKMQNSNCFVLFSDYENFPCVLLESLSTGTPAIATNVGGISEIINENNGILISTSEDELYTAMKDILEKKYIFDDAEKLHQYMVDRFSMVSISLRFDEIYRRVLR